MNRELEQKYLELQAAPKKVYFSQLPDNADVHEATTEAQEDDFVLTPRTVSESPIKPAAETKKPKAKAAPDMLADAPDDAPAPAPVAKAAAPAAPAEPGVAHSVATGGDALLDIAMSEETEARKKRRTRASGPIRTATGFIIFCPYGCKVEVKDQHRGMTGKCPKCRAPFVVPAAPPDYDFAREREKNVAEQAAASSAPGGFVAWMQDVHVHTVNPTKLKLKEGSLVKDFAPFDIGFGLGKMLVVSLAAKKGGMFGGKKGGSGDPREAILAHLKDGKPPEDVPAAMKKVYTADDVRQMRVVWPEASRAASAFHGVPVFGKQIIAVQLPLVGEGDPQYASFTLSQFRTFNKHLEELYGVEGLAANLGIPMTDEFTTSKCHYSEAQVKALKDADWYLADTSRPATIAGYRCESCGVTVSEAARKKEKLGGANGKGLAKATCPKCKKKFGNKPLYSLPEAESGPTMS